MSLIASLTKKSKLNATIKQTALARKSDGSKADGLFKAAYQGYADVLRDDPLRAEALYNWGFALLHQAKTKTGDEAARIYQDAIDKFAFCMLINPDYLGAAINGGVAFMDLARLKKVKPEHELYENAKKQFEKANAIQAGTASFNLACIYGLRGDKDACLKALEIAQDKVTLPEAGDILNDPDLVSVKEQDWFVEFMEKLGKKTEADSENKEVDTGVPSQKKWVIVERAAAFEETITVQQPLAEDSPEEEQAK
jgi:tetratricopeptide (TPR) repeat protein